MIKLRQIVSNFLSYYSLSAKSLSLMRLAIGTLVLADLFIRGSDLFAFYGEQGVWPSGLTYSYSGKPGMWTIHSLFKNDAWLVLLFVIHILVAIAFLIGYRTKVSNLLLWIFTISLHNRNLYILQAGDDLLRMVLFWGMFLPWDRHYSVSAPKYKASSKHIGQFAYLILLASVYYFTAELKSSPQWRSEFSALYHALSLDMYRSKIGDYVYQFPSLMQWLSGATLVIEYLLAILIIWPSKKGNNRLVAFMLVLLLQLSFGLCLKVGLFYLISVSAAIGLLPDKVFKTKTDADVSRPDGDAAENKYWPNIKNAIAITVMVLCLTLNFSSLPWVSYQPKLIIMQVANSCRFDQYWGMFAPSVPNENTWPVYMAYNDKGQQYDIRNDSEYVDFKHTAVLNNHFKSDRWKKLAENVQSDYYPFLRTHYCRYFIKQWNKTHPNKHMHHLTLYSMSETILLNYRKKEPTKKLLCLCDEE